MKKNCFTPSIQSNQLSECNHVQLGGMAYYDDRKYFMFAPSEEVTGLLPRFRRRGIGQQMADGTFDFVACADRRCQSKLIKKLAHGRVSKTKDEAIQLTLKVYCDEGVNISNALLREATEAANAVMEYQLKR